MAVEDEQNGRNRPFNGRRSDGPRRDGQSRGGDRRGSGDRPRRDGDRPQGERRPYGDRPQGERRSYGDRPQRDGERRPYGDRPQRDGGRGRFGDRPGGERSNGDRRSFGDRPRRDESRASRPPREQRIQGPEIPESIVPQMLDKGARADLKTLSKENADEVARHLVMAAELIDDDPQLAHEHALAAQRRAGRVGVVRETVAITAYAVGDFALALRELRTHRRLTGSNEQIALMVDSERGLGRPDRALEVGREVDRAALSADARVQLAIAMSGARLDLEQPELALAELEIPELQPDVAYPYSPDLFRAYATVLEELGRADEAAQWQRRAEIAEEALGLDEEDDLIVEDVTDHDVVIDDAVAVDLDDEDGDGIDDDADDDDALEDEELELDDDAEDDLGDEAESNLEDAAE